MTETRIASIEMWCSKYDECDLEDNHIGNCVTIVDDEGNVEVLADVR